MSTRTVGPKVQSRWVRSNVVIGGRQISRINRSRRAETQLARRNMESARRAKKREKSQPRKSRR